MVGDRGFLLILVFLAVTPGRSWWFFGCSRVNCVLSDWGNWGRCSQPCGHAGVAYRYRHVVRSARCGGSQCTGRREDAKTCNRLCHNGGQVTSSGCRCPSPYYGPCCESCHKQDCTWGSWGHWGNCSHPCGSGGTRTRMRKIVTKSQCGGASCHHGDREHEGCNNFCRNGGTPLFYGCRCQPGSYGTCCSNTNQEKITDEEKTVGVCASCANGGTRRLHGCQCTQDFYGNCCSHPVFGGESGKPTVLTGLYIGGAILIVGIVAGVVVLGCYCSNRGVRRTEDSPEVAQEMSEGRSRRYERWFPQVLEDDRIYTLIRNKHMLSSFHGGAPFRLKTIEL